MPITINDCRKCKSIEQVSVRRDWHSWWSVHCYCDHEEGVVFLQFFKPTAKKAVEKWNEQNPTKEEDNADNDK